MRTGLRFLSTARTSKDRLPFSVYIHWPYCSSKCTYCNFNKYLNTNVDHDRMEAALNKELETELLRWKLSGSERPIRSIYFGGGTPSLARPSMFKGVLEILDRHCNITKDTEVTMEGNPSSTTSVSTLQDLRAIGINRYSLGIQSFQPQILSKLGRDHSPSEGLRSLLDAKSVWPGRVNMDLIMAHSGQTLEQWKSELKFTLDIVDDHLSLYHLTVERGTQLHKDFAKGLVSLPGVDLATDMYEVMIEMTSTAGFEHYEVSNFARNKAYSMHNSGHWQGIDYLGIGPGAHGRVRDPNTGDRNRTFNIRDPKGWMSQCEHGGTGLRRTLLITNEEAKQEFIVLGMRTKLGVPFDQFRELCGQDLMEFIDKEAVETCLEAGLLTKSDDALAPTERGMAVADELVARLVP